MTEVADGYDCVISEENGTPTIIAPNGDRSDPVGYQGIARLGDYCATSQYYKSVLPAFFKITSFAEHG